MMMRTQSAPIAVFLAALLLTACSSQTPQLSAPTEPVITEVNRPESERPVESPAEQGAAGPSREDALHQLLEQAQLQYRYGQYRYAIGTAERGLRIDRSLTDWYLILAESYLKLGSPANAQQFARQGLRYSAPSGKYYRRLQAINDGDF